MNFKQLADLGSVRDSATTIVLPIALGDDRLNRTTLKSLLDGADIPLTDDLRALIDDGLAWDKQARSLMIFSSPDIQTLHWSPVEMPAITHTGDRFLVAPLLQEVSGAHAFGVLALQLGQWRMLTATRDHSARLALPDAPASVEDATEAVVDPIPGGSSHAHRTGDGTQANPNVAQHGFGQEDRQANDAALYFRDLDEALVGALGTELSVVLIADTSWASTYQESSGLNIVHRVDMNPTELDDDALRRLAWTSLETLWLDRARTALEAVAQATAQDKGTTDVDVVTKMGRMGGIDLLLVDDDALIEPDVNGAVVEALSTGATVLHLAHGVDKVSAALRFSHADSR